MTDKKNNKGMTRNLQNGLLALVVLVFVYFAARAVVQVRLLKDQNARLEDRVAKLEMLAVVTPDTLSARYVPFTGREKGRNAVPAKDRHSEQHSPEREVRGGRPDTFPVVDYVPATLNAKDDYPRQEKFKEPTRVELNSADTSLLKKIPGIGSATALNIIRYREQLGGFYSPLQLGEKLKWEKAQEMLPVWTSQWMAADTSRIQRLNVNRSDFKTLVRHPYLSYDQVKALVNYRRKWGDLPSMDVLSQLEEFSEDDIQRLRFYLEF